MKVFFEGPSPFNKGGLQLWTKRPIFGENKYKTTFFHMSDFLGELSYLIHCKHFDDVFSPIVIVTSRNIIFFVLMKKKKL